MVWVFCPRLWQISSGLTLNLSAFFDFIQKCIYLNNQYIFMKDIHKHNLFELQNRLSQYNFSRSFCISEIIFIIIIMQPPPLPKILPIFQNDDILNEINILSTNALSKINSTFQNLRESLGLKKVESFEVSEKFEFNELIEKLVLELLKVRNSLEQIMDPNLYIENKKSKEYINEFLTEAKKCKKTLMLRESQLDSVNHIIKHEGKVDEKEYNKKYELLGKFMIKLGEKMNINKNVIEEAMELEVGYLKEYLEAIELVSLDIIHRRYLTKLENFQKNANRIKIINSKIVTIAEIFPYACSLSSEDLFSHKKDHERWKKLTETSITFRNYKDRKSIRKSFDSTKQGVIVHKSQLNFVNATMSIIDKTKNLTLKENWQDILASSNRVLKCAIFKQDAHHEAQVLISAPDGKLAKEIWNLPQQKMLRNIVATAFPFIQFSQQIRIPRLFQDYLSSGTDKLPELTIENLQKYSQQMYKQQPHEEKLQMRINNAFILKNMFEKGPKRVVRSMVSFFKGKEPEAPQTVIYHIHGGGFISMSSFVHQTYTRIWANNLKVPIVSVDYGKAPEYPFPSGLHDCFEGYMWTLFVFRQIYDVQPKKIILVGDSAGGNLIAALTNMLIEKKLKTPDGIVLVYPALNLNYFNYSPSLLSTLDDMVLPHTFLKICLEAYLKQDAKPESDHLISPIITPDHILNQYPPTRIFVGSKDPFHDDCCRLTERLNLLKEGTAKLTVFEEFPHGFLQFDVKAQPNEFCRKATKEVEEALGELMLL